MMRRLPHRSVLLLVASLAGAAATAESTLDWQLEPDGPLVADAHRLLEADQPSTSRGVVRMLQRTHVHFGAEQVTQTVQLVYYYPTADSVQNDASDSITWDAWHEQVTVLEAASVRPDGTVSYFDPVNAEVIDNDTRDVFTDQNDVIIQIPGIAVGGMSVIAYRKTVTDVQNFLLQEWLRNSLPTRRLELEVTWTDTAPNWHVDPGFVECVEEAQRLRCVGEDLAAADLDRDVLYPDVLPTLTIASPRSWDSVIGEMRAKVAAAVEPVAAAESLLEDFRLAADPIQAVHDLASRQIRYVSFSRGEHSHQPHSVKATLENRYGDCKDKSTLMYALLSRLGHDAYPVLVATQRERPQGLPVPSREYFDHMVVCMREPAGERCFDPTDPYSSSKETPYHIQGKVRLNLLAGSTPERVPLDRHRWRLNVVNHLAFAPDGSQQETLHREFTGPYAAWMRGSLGARDEADQQVWLRDQYQQTVSGDAVPEFQVERLDDIEVPLVISSTHRFPPFVDTEARLDYTDGAFWIGSFLEEQRIDNEHYGVRFPGLMLTSEQHFDTGTVWQVTSTGATVDFQSEYGRFTRRYESDEAGVVVHTEAEMPERYVPPEEFARFNRFVELMMQETTLRIWGEVRVTAGSG